MKTEHMCQITNQIEFQIENSFSEEKQWIQMDGGRQWLKVGSCS